VGYLPDLFVIYNHRATTGNNSVERYIDGKVSESRMVWYLFRS